MKPQSPMGRSDYSHLMSISKKDIMKNLNTMVQQKHNGATFNIICQSLAMVNITARR